MEIKITLYKMNNRYILYRLNDIILLILYCILLMFIINKNKIIFWTFTLILLITLFKNRITSRIYYFTNYNIYINVVTSYVVITNRKMY